MAPAKGVSDFEVEGSFGDEEPLTVTYSHRPGGKTVLEVDSYFGRVLKRQVTP